MSSSTKRARAFLNAPMSRSCPNWFAWISAGQHGPPPPVEMEPMFAEIWPGRGGVVEPDAPPGWATLENVR